ncbi:MAG: TetR/AcrR family transcriptional regulator [Hyphomonadaceae bacterium]|nr:TetR/AcrR family transcriptional regulator [Hyphomonadaceae bacterium]
MSTPQGLNPRLEAPLADRGVARRAAFLEAARAVFLEQGYEASSVNDVVRRAGGSLATLYAQFGNKEGLFLAVLQDQHERMLAAMTPDCVKHLGVEAGLRAIGEKFLRAILTRENRAFFRLVISEGRKFPDSALKYISSGGERVRHVVADHMRAAGLTVEDAEVSASFFLELLRSRHHFRAMIDDQYQLSDVDLRAHVAGAVEFLTRRRA